MTNLTSRLEIEALRQASSVGRTRAMALVRTIVPFAAALGLLWVIGGEVRQKRAELAVKGSELQARSAELVAVDAKVKEARAELQKTTELLQKSRKEADEVQRKVTEATSLLTLPMREARSSESSRRALCC